MFKVNDIMEEDERMIMESKEEDERVIMVEGKPVKVKQVLSRLKCKDEEKSREFSEG